MLQALVAFFLFFSHCRSLARMNTNSVPSSLLASKRIENTENPYIEDVLDHYSALNIPNLTYLAMGSTINTSFASYVVTHLL